MDHQITPPPRLLFKPVKIQWKDLFKSIPELALSFGTSNWPAAIKALWTTSASWSFDKSKPNEVAWLWISRSLARAVAALIAELPKAHRERCPTNINEISETLAATLQGEEISLEREVFYNPKKAPFLRIFQGPLSQWLQKFGLDAAAAATIAGRLPGYFAVALDREWLERPDEYRSVKDALDGPASAAAQLEGAWRAHFGRLQKEIDKPVFDEPFGLDQIYVWPRAYYEEKLPPDHDKPDYKDFRRARTKRRAFWLKDELLKWLETDNPKDALRVISGGPGSGKSSFTKMLAAELAKQHRWVLRIPLCLLDLQRSWDEGRYGLCQKIPHVGSQSLRLAWG